MRAMPYAYTNRLATDGLVVRKTYRGPEARARHMREQRALRRLAGVLPVPALVSTRPGECTTVFVDGIPAQEAMVPGDARQVLWLCGQLLARLQRVDPALVLGEAVPSGAVLVHNDFGPHNVVLAPDLASVRLLCDWEWVAAGAPEADIAWAEFVVRYHHPDAVGALAALFDGFGDRPAWAVRQAAMAARAAGQREFGRRWRGAEGARTWDRRLAAIASWTDGA